MVTGRYSFPFDASHNPHLKKKKKKTPPPHSGHFLPRQVWGNGVQHIRFRKKPGTEKEAGLVLGILVRLPVASAAAIRCSQVCALPSYLRASLLPAHINQGSDGRREVWAGRSGDWGAEVPEAPAPGGWEGPTRGAVCLFFFWTGPAPDCPSLALLPLTCRVSVSRGSG